MIKKITFISMEIVNVFDLISKIKGGRTLYLVFMHFYTYKCLFVNRLVVKNINIDNILKLI